MYACFIYLGKAQDSIVRTLLWKVLARFSVPQMILVMHQFHDGMRACVKLVYSECSVGFPGNGVFAEVYVFSAS